MWQELFRIPIPGWREIPVYGYGLMLVLGVILAISLAKALSRRRGIDPELFVNAGLLAMLSGVAGARLSHVLENWSEYFNSQSTLGQSLWRAVNISSGGLTYYGGFILATGTLLWYGRRKKVSLRVGMDIVAPCLMIGLAFGRLGCFLNGCCYGAACDLPWAVKFPYHSYAYVEQVEQGKIRPPDELMLRLPGGRTMLAPPDMIQNDSDLRAIARAEHTLAVHPTQLYSTITALLIAAVLLTWMPLCKVPGRVFALMLIIEPVTRFLLEMLRVEPAVLGPLSFSMVMAIPQFVVALILWWGFGWYQRRAERTVSAADEA